MLDFIKYWFWGERGEDFIVAMSWSVLAAIALLLVVIPFLLKLFIFGLFITILFKLLSK